MTWVTYLIFGAVFASHPIGLSAEECFQKRHLIEDRWKIASERYQGRLIDGRTFTADDFTVECRFGKKPEKGIGE